MRISDWSSDVCSSDLTDLGQLWDQAIVVRTLEMLNQYHRYRQIVRQVGQNLAHRIGPTGAGEDHHCPGRSEEHTSELQSLMRISYAVFCLKKKKKLTSTL